jgi:all-trans-retinol 13,14-reductase
MTARNNEKYLNTPRGAIYGFAPQPPRMHFFKPGTPVDGLWLASAYGGFGGYSGAILSGAAAARAGRKTFRR